LTVTKHWKSWSQNSYWSHKPVASTITALRS